MLWGTGESLRYSTVIVVPAFAVMVWTSNASGFSAVVSTFTASPGGGPGGPEGGGGLGVGVALASSIACASQASYSGRSTARTVKYMSACARPQNSAHWPPYVPGFSMTTSNSLIRPGTASFL